MRQPRIARSDSLSEPIVARTADGSYPQCAMQFAHCGYEPSAVLATMGSLRESIRAMRS